MSSQPEVEWDEEQQAWMLALQLYEETRCPGCGGNITVTTASENEGKYRHDLPLQCFRCVAFGIGHDAYADQPRPESFIHLVPGRPRTRG